MLILFGLKRDQNGFSLTLDMKVVTMHQSLWQGHRRAAQGYLLSDWRLIFAWLTCQN